MRLMARRQVAGDGLLPRTRSAGFGAARVKLDHYVFTPRGQPAAGGRSGRRWHSTLPLTVILWGFTQ
jgi:hypothetical protein